MSKHRNLNSITERYYIPLVPAFKKTDCTSFHDGTRWFFLLFPPPPKKNMLGSRNAGVMSRTGINQKEIILRKFIVDRSTPNFIKIRKCFEGWNVRKDESTKEGIRFRVPSSSNQLTASNCKSWNFGTVCKKLPIPEEARVKAWVYGRSFAGNAGTNPTGIMDAYFLWILYVVRYRSLRRADHSSRGILTSVVCPLDATAKPHKGKP